MKFIASSSELLKQLQIINGVTGTNTTLTVLNNFLFELSENQLFITGSDGETTIKSSLNVTTSDKGSFLVPAKILTDALKTFSEQPLTFIKDENQLEIVDEVDNYFFAVENADEFPSFPKVEVNNSVTMKASVLAEAIAHTFFATGNDAMRPIMTGVLFQFTPTESRFVATDAHRLVKYTRKDVISKAEIDIIMPKKPLMLLKNALAGTDEEVVVEFSQTNARFSLNNTTWICRLIDGKYPNYDAVIPKDNPNLLTINTQLLLNSLRRAALFSNKSTNQVRLKIEGNTLNINAEDLDFANKADITIPCDYNGEDMQIGFNTKFLNEMVSNIPSEELYMELSLPNRAGILKPVDGLEESEELLMLVMPVMINV